MTDKIEKTENTEIKSTDDLNEDNQVQELSDKDMDGVVGGKGSWFL